MCSLLSLEFYLAISNAKPVLSCSSKMQQEIEFQIGSPLPGKSCKIVSISYTSRAIHCALYSPLEFYVVLIHQTCPFDISISYVEQEIDFQLGIKLLVNSFQIASLS